MQRLRRRTEALVVGVDLERVAKRQVPDAPDAEQRCRRIRAVDASKEEGAGVDGENCVSE